MTVFDAAATQRALEAQIDVYGLLYRYNLYLRQPEDYPLTTLQVKVMESMLDRKVPKMSSIKSQGHIDTDINITITAQAAPEPPDAPKTVTE